MESLSLLIIGGIVLLFILIVGLVYSRLYHESDPDTALVRTGVGGMEIVQGGGILVIPSFQRLNRVNMKAVPIPVNSEGLITKDQRRVDANFQLYIKVTSDKDAIRKAAQSLGSQINDRNAIREFLEGKVQGVIRDIAAGMNLIDLHENREEFTKNVRETMNKELAPNGLELETVSMPNLDETSISKLKGDNTFDVTGRRARAEIIADQSKRTVEVEEQAALDIARTQQENRVRRLEVEKTEAEATEKQRIDIARMRAEANTQEVQINAQLERDREVAEVNREAEVRKAQIERQQEMQIAQQQADIKIANNSEARSQAEAAANKARAEAAASEEAIKTAAETAAAERGKRVAVIEAERQAEQQAAGVRIQARAEREAAEDRASAIIAEARAEAEANEIRAKAISEVGKAEAEARAALVEAENGMSDKVIAFKLRQETIARLPEIIQAMTEPMRHVDKFSISQISGLGGAMSGDGQGAGGAGGEDGVVNDLMRGMRRNAVAMPTLNALGNELGLNFAGGFDKVVEGLIATDIGSKAEGETSGDETPVTETRKTAPATTSVVGGAARQRQPKKG